MPKQWVGAFAGLLLASLIAPAAADDATKAAQAIAQKFSGGGPRDLEKARQAEDSKRRAAEKAREAARKAAETKRLAEEARREAEALRADEAEMLARARSEAEARHAEDQRLTEEEIRREEERHAAAASRLREAEDKAREAERVAREAEAAEQARETERIAREAEAAELTRETERIAREAEAAELARETERIAREAEERRIVEERRVETAGSHLSEDESETRLAPGADYEPPRRQTAPRERAALGGPDFGGPDFDRTADRAFDGRWREPVTRVTVLLIMEPGHRGIRLFGRATADPMICLSARCYIGAGAGVPATELSRSRAFGAGVALGGRAGACRNSLTCVFRDVDLGAERAALQPIDLRILRHDRRETKIVSADLSCGVSRGRLFCGETVSARDYRAWIVPEQVARRAGPDALLAALGAGLEDDGDRRSFVGR